MFVFFPIDTPTVGSLCLRSVHLVPRARRVAPLEDLPREAAVRVPAPVEVATAQAAPVPVAVVRPVVLVVQLPVGLVAEVVPTAPATLPVGRPGVTTTVRRVPVARVGAARPAAETLVVEPVVVVGTRPAAPWRAATGLRSGRNVRGIAEMLLRVVAMIARVVPDLRGGVLVGVLARRVGRGRIVASARHGAGERAPVAKVVRLVSGIATAAGRATAGLVTTGLARIVPVRTAARVVTSVTARRARSIARTVVRVVTPATVRPASGTATTGAPVTTVPVTIVPVTTGPEKTAARVGTLVTVRLAPSTGRTVVRARSALETSVDRVVTPVIVRLVPSTVPIAALVVIPVTVRLVSGTGMHDRPGVTKEAPIVRSARFAPRPLGRCNALRTDAWPARWGSRVDVLSNDETRANVLLPDPAPNPRSGSTKVPSGGWPPELHVGARRRRVLSEAHVPGQDPMIARSRCRPARRPSGPRIFARRSPTPKVRSIANASATRDGWRPRS